MSNVAWIGTGVMGAAQAGHLVKAGHTVKVFNRSMDKALSAAKTYGFQVCPTIREAVKDADFVFVMVGYPIDVEEVFLCPDGILNNVRPGTIVADMTTSSPSLAQKLYLLGKEKDIAVLDAPVSGGDRGAREATLSIMVGGDSDAFEKITPLLQSMGKSILHMGPAGAGQHTKACNQIAVAGATAAYTEAILYAEKAGIDPSKMLSVIAGGAAGSWQIDNMGPRALAGDFAPGFYVKHFIKDLKIVKEEADQKGIDLKVLNTVLELYERFVKEDPQNNNTGSHALIEFYREQ